MSLEDLSTEDQQPDKNWFSWIRWYSPATGLLFLALAVWRRFFVVKDGPDLGCYLLLVVGIFYILISAILEAVLQHRKRQEVLKAIRSRKTTVRIDDR